VSLRWGWAAVLEWLQRTRKFKKYGVLAVWVRAVSGVSSSWSRLDVRMASQFTGILDLSWNPVGQNPVCGQYQSLRVHKIIDIGNGM